MFIGNEDVGVRIVCSAIKLKNGDILVGVRHLDGIMREQLEVKGYESKDLANNVQGFITNKGEFVDRKEAWKIANEANQIIRLVSSCYDGHELFSENLF